MNFTLHGNINNKPSEITWADGQLSGDPLAVALASGAAEGLEMEAVGPPAGPYTITKHLLDPVSFYFLVSENVFNIQSYDGDKINWPDEVVGVV